jgi:uncharacterized membrane protein YsdA (DUF1294 family)/cold shock CspA family protein
VPERGRLTEWNDERGFGFITPLGGDTRVFVHVSQFPRDKRRPMATDLVTYTLSHDERNRPQAHDVAFLAPVHEHHEDARPFNAFELLMPFAFMVLLLVLIIARLVQPVVFWFYVVLSLVAFAMYWRDKVAATAGQWRTSETALIGIAVAGGWPGAYLARHIFRHKTRKQPFRAYFWVAVAVNCALLASVVLGMRAAPG